MRITQKKLDSLDQETVEIAGYGDDKLIWKRAVETIDFIYFVDYSGNADDNTSTLMYRKKDLGLICNNYFATNDLAGVIEDETYTWISEEAKHNFIVLANLV